MANQCSGSINLNNFYTINQSCPYTIDVKIDGTPITNPVPISPLSTPIQIQNLLNANRINNLTGSFVVTQSVNDLIIQINNLISVNPTPIMTVNVVQSPQTQILSLSGFSCTNFNPGDSILGLNGSTGTVISFSNPNLVINVLSGNFDSEPSITNTTTECTANVEIVASCTSFQPLPSFLTCTFVPTKKKKNRGVALPMICCNPKQFPNQVCPPVINMSGYYYDRVENSNCYVLRKKK